MRISIALILFAAACGSKTPTANPPPPPPENGAGEHDMGAMKPPVDETQPPAPAPTKPVTNKSLASIGLDPAAIDKGVDPCDDFYQFACGNWIKTKEIDADKPVAMRSFVDIEDRNNEYEHGILDQIVAKPGKDPVNKQLSAFYGSCMDEATIEKQGIKPIKPLLDVIGRVKDPKSLSAAVAALHAAGFSVLFNMGPVQDSADASKVIAGMDQGGIGLPDRDYYLKDDAQSKMLKGAYEGYVAAMLVQLGHKEDAAKTEAGEIVGLETELAKISKDKVARRDPKTMYNRLDKKGVAAAAPDFDWATYWKAQGLAKVDAVTVGAPDFLKGMDALVKATKPEVWRNYLAFHLANKAAGSLTNAIEDTQFKFYAALTGQKEQRVRWKRCVDRTDGALGDLLGQVFVRDKFGGASKTAAEEQVHAIVTAMTANLDALPWMDAATKGLAKAKLAAMTYQIGFPNKWKKYTFKLDAKTWGANSLAARKAENDRQNAKIGKPVDKDDWQMTVPQVNAYYDPQLNGMVFPAGILQPPFYSVDASVAVNLGGMGVVVGHELTHGFDDQGAQYDAVGNLKDWWAPETEKLFKQRTQCVIDQYSGYEVVGGTKLNGANTVGENIADIGGVKLSYRAYHSLRDPAPETIVADGFTEDQQFFLGFGQAWCAKMRPDYEKLLATVDVHSPAKWRVNGALSATPEFGKAFRCKASAKMVPKNQCVVW